MRHRRKRVLRRNIFLFYRFPFPFVFSLQNSPPPAQAILAASQVAHRSHLLFSFLSYLLSFSFSFPRIPFFVLTQNPSAWKSSKVSATVTRIESSSKRRIAFKRFPFFPPRSLSVPFERKNEKPNEIKPRKRPKQPRTPDSQ